MIIYDADECAKEARDLRKKIDSVIYDISPFRSWAVTLNRITLLLWFAWAMCAWWSGNLSGRLLSVADGFIWFSAIVVVLDLIGRLRKEPKP
jgi:hypothetical protein